MNNWFIASACGASWMITSAMCRPMCRRRACAQSAVCRCSRGSWVEYVITTSGAEPAARRLAPLDYQHYIDRQLEPVADGILGFVGSSFRTLVDKQIDLF